MSDDKPFDPPHVRLNRIYTRGGDAGDTSLVGGRRTGKEAVRIQCYGEVDELNALLGMAAVTAGAHPELARLTHILARLQHELFNLGSNLATLPEDVRPRQPRVTGQEVDRLEREIDELNAVLEPLASFVLPGGCRLNAELHLARTVCRRAERSLVALSRREAVPPEALQYLNRLSDALFVYSRWASHVLSAPEILWEPNQAAKT